MRHFIITPIKLTNINVLVNNKYVGALAISILIPRFDPGLSAGIY